jgi:hypothetical protein
MNILKNITKKSILLFCICLLSLSNLAYGNPSENCLAQENFHIIDSYGMNSLLDLIEVSEANKKKQDIIKAKITYGFFGVGVGDADIFLTTKDGKIVDLNVSAKVGILGINSYIKQKVRIDQLIAGQPLEFKMEGGNQAVLIIQPDADFSENGGWASLKVWDGTRYSINRIAITQGKSGSTDYQAYHNNISPSDRVKGLSILMRGSNIPKMYVEKFTIEK